MIKFLKKIKSKFYYVYIDKVVNSPANLEINSPQEKDESKTLIVELPANETAHTEVVKPAQKASLSTEKKKPGRPKTNVADSVKTPAKKTPVKKSAPKKA